MAFAFLKSKTTEEPSWRDLLILGIAVCTGMALYLYASKLTFTIGFPLDDSWIHQTYARNLSMRGEWAFRPGIQSTGSTSPLWALLLVPGYLFRLFPFIWTYLLGGVSLLGLAYICEWAARKFIPAYRPGLPWIGIFIAFEWHLAWAALSGMETILQALITTLVLILIISNTRRFLLLGLLTGISIWIRPDGLTLLGPIIVSLAINRNAMQTRLRHLGNFLIGFGALLLPYLMFNFWYENTPMPNTFYAKQAEYNLWQMKPLGEKLWVAMLQLFVGPSVILLPGLFAWLYKAGKKNEWNSLVAATWCVCYMGIYIMRLPPYQHGRYLMPAMPVMFLFGLLGLLAYKNTEPASKSKWLLQTFWLNSLGVVWAAFIYMGARAYALDVAVIESELVNTARWVDANIPYNSLIAAHDIGALGYYDDHELIDLAGLISPEVIPFIRNEEKIALYLDRRGAEYLIVFPDFYPSLTRTLEVVHTTESPYASLFGEEHLTVYRWESSK